MNKSNDINKVKNTKSKKQRKPLKCLGSDDDVSVNDDHDDDNGDHHIYTLKHYDARKNYTKSIKKAFNTIYCHADDDDDNNDGVYEREDVFGPNIRKETRKSRKCKNECDDELRELLRDAKEINENHRKAMDKKSDGSDESTDDCHMYESRKSLRNKREKKQKRKSLSSPLKKAFEETELIQTLCKIEKLEEKSNSRDKDNDICSVPTVRQIEVKVKYEGCIHRFPIREDQCFHQIMPHIAEWCQQESSALNLFLNGSLIASDDTISSRNITIGDIIECYKRAPNNKNQNGVNHDPNIWSLKVQDKTKNPLIIKISKFDPILKLMTEYSKIKGIELSHLKFKYDDEEIDPNASPMDLDLENDTQIDAIETR